MIRTQRISLPGMTNYIHREHAYGGQTHVAHSEMLVCPHCQRVWAYLNFVDEDLSWPMAQFCEECGIKTDWHPVPGSILVEEGWGCIDEALLAGLPDHLVKREFDLHMKAYL